MTVSQHKLLVVDDDHFLQNMILKTLQDDYELKMADDGDQGLAIAPAWVPDAILLDVEMPGKSGYEVCKLLKKNPATVNIPVIFLSAKDSQREKLLGFEAGAEDYMVKPFEPEILSARVRRAIQQYTEKLALSQQALLAQSTAFEAMTSSSELGRILRFSEHTFSVATFDELAAALFQTLSEFDLHASVMFESNSGELFYSYNSATISPFEKDLMQINHANSQRFRDFGGRTFCNFRQTCILIKNMPLESPEHYGRIKDFIPFLLGAVDGKVRTIDLHTSLTAQSASLGRSVDIIGKTLSTITQEVTETNATSTETMTKLLNELSFRLPTMGLEDDQESYLLSSIDTAFSQTIFALEKNSDYSQSLMGIVRLMEHLRCQQEKLLKNTLIERQPMASDMPNDGASLSGDIEFF